MNHEEYMRQALRYASQAYALDEVPIGAVVVNPQGAVIGSGFNRREIAKDPTAHAEILAIRDASQHYGDWRLYGCAIYVTVEPCLMCAGAIALSRIETVYYGASSPKSGALGSLCNLYDVQGFNHYPSVTAGVLGEECAMILADFFRGKRSSSSV